MDTQHLYTARSASAIFAGFAAAGKVNGTNEKKVRDYAMIVAMEYHDTSSDQYNKNIALFEGEVPFPY